MMSCDCHNLSPSSPELFMATGKVQDVSHKNWKGNNASDHVIAVPLVYGLPYDTLTLSGGHFLVVNGVNRVWFQNEQRIREDRCNQTSSDKERKTLFWVTVVCTSSRNYRLTPSDSGKPSLDRNSPSTLCDKMKYLESSFGRDVQQH